MSVTNGREQNVSVVIPVHNRSTTIGQAIESAFTQSFPPSEVIVVDDGSTDATVEVVAREQERWGPRLQLLRQDHGERGAARNRGIDAASGDYLAFLDSDDVWRESHLEDLVGVLRGNPDAVAAIADYGILSEDGRIVRDHVPRTTENGGRDRRRTLEGDYRAQLRALVRQDIVIHPSEVVVSRPAVLAAGRFDSDIPGAEDWLLWVRLAREGKMVLTCRPTVWMRRSPDNTFSRPEQFAGSIRAAAECVVATGTPHDVGVPGNLVRAIAYVHGSATYALTRSRRRSLELLGRAIVTYPSIVFERRFWLPVRRLVLGGVISDAISRWRWSPSDQLAEERLRTYEARARTNTTGPQGPKTNVSQNQSDPLVSVVIASHNRWPLVRDAVDSALDQERGTAEIIVVDDGSTDGTADLLEAERPTVRVVRQTNTERGAARNHGLRLASGRFVVFLDADDVLESWYLAQFVDRWKAMAGSDAIYVCPSQRWRPESGRIQPMPLAYPKDGQPLHTALQRTIWGVDSAVIPRSVALAVGGFPEDREAARSEDWVFQVRMLAMGVPVEILSRPAVRHREHLGRSTNDDLACIASRQAALNMLLRDGVAGRQLTPSERALAIAGTHRYCAAHAYGAGHMREARWHLRKVRHHLGWRRGIATSWRLWLQTWLGARGSQVARRVRGGHLQSTPPATM
jgi:glycosyltransferase involved in cell wall biosynthesis